MAGAPPRVCSVSTTGPVTMYCSTMAIPSLISCGPTTAGMPRSLSPTFPAFPNQIDEATTATRPRPGSNSR